MPCESGACSAYSQKQPGKRQRKPEFFVINAAFHHSAIPVVPSFSAAQPVRTENVAGRGGLMTSESNQQEIINPPLHK